MVFSFRVHKYECVLHILLCFEYHIQYQYINIVEFHTILHNTENKHEYVHFLLIVNNSDLDQDMPMLSH